MKKALAVLMTLSLLLIAVPTLAEEKVAPLTMQGIIWIQAD